ncbi:hypothetical protein AGDE_11805 [Angomonas deanei]|nr:hypothetical protein AGDE_11805 [Angomonas deanei]|eukprot:EPY25402.1 hypothetical protein AGDE_11805 [Angomonas deanei]
MRGLSMLLSSVERDGGKHVEGEDLLLLAMFFEELTTVSQSVLLRYYCRCVVSLYRIAVPILLQAGSKSEEQEETDASLREVLTSLRGMLGKRLTSTVKAISGPSLQIQALGCLTEIFKIYARQIRNSPSAAEDAKNVGTLFIEPLEFYLECARGGSAGGVRGSVLVASSLLTRVEELVWILAPSKASAELDALHSECYQDLLNSVLAVLLKYITDQQHKGVGQSGTGAEGGAGDVFREYSVQLSLQRLLSTALFLFPTYGAADVGTPPWSSLKSGLLSAVNFFGGVTPVTQSPLEEKEPTSSASEENPWRTDGAVLPCTCVIPVKEEHVTTIENEEELERLDDNELLLIGDDKGTLLKTTFGLVSPRILVDMVMNSVARLPLGISVDGIRQFHLEGLQHMQFLSAKRAQREEYERARLIEREGIEAFSPSELITQVKNTGTVHQQGMQLLRRPSSRAYLQKCAFLSVLHSYPFLDGEGEARIRATQALVARCLVQLPSTLFDGCVDQVFLLFSSELATLKENSVNCMEVVSKSSSYYQLLLQILFMSFASLAPFEERTSELSLQLQSEDSPAASLTFQVEAKVDIENPVAFLQEKDTSQPSYSGKKRTREEADAEPSGVFNFANDTRAAPSNYSYILCRLLELLYESQSIALLADLLVQAPGLPRYVWNYIFRHFCLPPDRCKVGVLLLKYLAVHREVYRVCAINLLVHLSVSSNELARRCAIVTINSLLQMKTGQRGANVIDSETERLLLHYAKNHMTVIPNYVPSKKNEHEEEIGPEQLVLDATDKCNRQFGLFLMLCVRNPKELFVALMDTYVQCVEQNNVVMTSVLPENGDVKRMTQRLLEMDPQGFATTVMPILVRYSKKGSLLVQSMLWSICDTLRELAKTVPIAELSKIASVIVENAKSMYKNATIKTGSFSVPDIRFLAPFLGFLPKEELRSTYLVSLLYFIQVQLQFKGDKSTLPIQTQSYILSPSELNTFMVKAVKEIVVKCSIPFQDKVPRGMSHYEWFVYLHCKPQELLTDPSVVSGSMPPISATTIRTVVSLCLQLTKSFNQATTEKLYDWATVERAIRTIVSTTPVPSQLMATVIIATDMFVKMNLPEFVRSMVQHVLMPLVRQAVYDTDPEGLWMGVLVFCENYYHECSAFLIDLPDVVLTKALRERRRLRELFTEEHGNNAMFARILGNL